MEKNNYTISFVRALMTLILFVGLQPSYLMSQSGEVINLGLYGGASEDFAWQYSTNRLFSAVETPASLFFSDDSCATWTQPFSPDSLEYTTAGTRRGWGGGAVRVLTNRSGWVGVQTAEQGGTLTSSVISYNNGDSATFKTAFDGYLLNQLNSSYSTNTSVSAIALSEDWFYVGMGSVLLRTNNTVSFGASNIILDLTTEPGAGTNTNINWLAVADTTSGYPILIVANVSGNSYGKLFSYDGTTLSEISGLPSGYQFERVFVHPLDDDLDTIVASVMNTSTSQRRLYLTKDGGSSWTHISPSAFGTNWPLQNADYSPNWEALMPNSLGLRLSYPGVEKSDDLGSTWSNHMLEDNATATHPTDTSYVVGSKNKGPQLSTGGAQGSFINQNNEGHSAVRITKIAQKGTNIYYVATKAGLGYTLAYKNPAVVGVDKWRAPYGDFPISGVGGDGGVTSVAIDPTDSLHVIVGSNNAFYVSTTGPTGFSNVVPADWNSGTQQDAQINDIKFITSDTIVAVSGTGSNTLPDPSLDYGNIWMSYDGGSSWTKINPSDTDGSGTTVYFEQGNTCAIGWGSSDTAIYVGCGYFDMNNPKEDGQIWKSTDFGTTWSFVNYGPTGQNGGTTHIPIYDMDVHPNPDSNQVIYIASGENLDYAFCKTTDGGATYAYLPVTGHGSFSSVLIKKSDPVIVSVAARRNLFRYNSVFMSSTTVFTGLPGEFVPDLETGSTLLGTTTGFYKLNESAGSITTIWRGDGNWSDASKWSNGIPYDICNAIIDSGTVTLGMDATINNLSMSPKTGLTVSSGFTLTTSDDFILDSDETGYASFINEGNISIGDSIIIKRYISADQWHYISSPIQNSTANSFFGMYLKYYDEAAKDWVYVTAPTEELLAGKGYSTWSPGSGTGDIKVQFSGSMYTGDYSPTLTLSGDPNSDYGWNLVGNRFTSALDWGTANSPTSGLNATNLDNTIYFYTGSQYATYNPAGNGGDGLATNGASQYIASSQGFFVHANASSPTLTIPESGRVHNDQGFFTPASLKNGILKIKVEADNYSDETVIAFNEVSVDQFEPEFDAYKLYGINAAPQLYTYSANERLAVNTLPFEGQVMSIPLYLESGSPGIHTLFFSGIIGFEDDMLISLEDTKEGTLINLRENPEYSFYASPGDNFDRFIIHFDATTMGNPEFDQPSDILVFTSNNKINISNLSGSLRHGNIKVFDVLGRKVYSDNITLIGNAKLNIGLKAGTYFVMYSENDNVLTKKVIIK